MGSEAEDKEAVRESLEGLLRDVVGSVERTELRKSMEGLLDAVTAAVESPRFTACQVEVLGCLFALRLGQFELQRSVEHPGGAYGSTYRRDVLPQVVVVIRCGPRSRIQLMAWVKASTASSFFPTGNVAVCCRKKFSQCASGGR